MKARNCKTLFATASAGLLCAAALISLQPTAVLAAPVQGQDKTGKNCERKDTPESSTFGKCENVCKDKDVTRDAENNRWVCNANAKAPGSQAPVNRVPITEKVLEPSANPNPKQPLPTRWGTQLNGSPLDSTPAQMGNE